MPIPAQAPGARPKGPSSSGSPGAGAGGGVGAGGAGSGSSGGSGGLGSAGELGHAAPPPPGPGGVGGAPAAAAARTRPPVSEVANGEGVAEGMSRAPYAFYPCLPAAVADCAVEPAYAHRLPALGQEQGG